jgi:hypothetical protein
MEIKDILDKLGIDLSNPEARRGAMEAIDAILSSRAAGGMGGGGSIGGGGQEVEVEIDPDLLQPSIKATGGGADDPDIEIEDKENVLGQVKHKDSKDPIDAANSSGDDSSNDDEETDSKNTDTKDQSTTSGKGEPDDEESDDDEEIDDDGAAEHTDDDDTDSIEGDEPDDSSDVAAKKPTAEDEEDEEFGDDEEDVDESEDDNGEDEDGDRDDGGGKGGDGGDGEDQDDEEDEDHDEYDPADDILDDTFDQSFEDEEVRTKQNARRIKRERTLMAAKAALDDAKAKNVSPALIRELEKAIEALESLTEAAAKSLKDISDEEFNRLINRTLDAIQACGDSGLTFTSDEERQAKVKEIKADLAKAETQNELSAEDVAQIRKETQAIRAREKEADKYKRRDAGSFKGFQDFLSSLYKAIALQVSNEETRDDTWSAISRRNSGAGVLRQGQRVNDLPNKKIPVIDFYFDTSTSWGADDIKVGMKAVSQLADMEEKGQIKLNIFYFSDEVSTTPIRGGTSGWNEIVKNIIATQATNVVVMTDSDMQHWWVGPKALSYTVPGYVWYLWKNGLNAPRLPQDLKGRGGVQQFSFNINDA